MTTLDTKERVTDFCRSLADDSFVTVDTEFVRDKTYWPELCLVQLAGSRGSAVIDALSDDMDLTPVFDVLTNPRILKVFHAASQDLEVFFIRMNGRVVTPVFDTQIAAMACGLGNQASYGDLVREFTDSRVSKQERLTDWKKRPLSKQQVAYAESDVSLLRDIYRGLTGRIDKLGRADWLKSEMAQLSAASNYALVPEDAWKRVKIRNPTRRELGVLRELATWREKQAQERDRPRRWIMSDELLSRIAKQASHSSRNLDENRLIPTSAVRGRYGKAIRAACRRGLNLPSSQLPDIPETAPTEKAPKALLDLAKALIRDRCERETISSGFVASTSEISRFVAGCTQDSVLASGWRYELFGRDIERLRDGKYALRVREGALELTEI